MYYILVLIFLLIYKIPGEEICSKSMITVRWRNSTKECLPCVTCRRGWGASYSCGDVVEGPPKISIKCERCKRRDTFSPGRSSDACKKCSICRPNNQVIKKCTRSADTRCGGCKSGYYTFRGPHFSSCEKCSACCGDAKDERIEECAKQALPRDQRCSSRQNRNCDKTSTSNKTVQPTADHKPTTSPATLQMKEKQEVFKDTVKPPAGRNYQIIHINNTNTGLTIATVIVIVIVVAVLVLILVVLIVWYRKRRRNGSKEQDSTSVESSTNMSCELRRLKPDDDVVEEEEEEEEEGEEENKQPNNDRNEKEDEPGQAPSCPLKEFIKDKDEWSVYEDICLLLNTIEHPDREKHFYSMSHAFGIDPNTAEKIWKDKRGSAQALFDFLKITEGEITLEQIARVIGRLHGRAQVAKMLREADNRLKRKARQQQQGD